jgi:hypothetical protein
VIAVLRALAGQRQVERGARRGPQLAERGPLGVEQPARLVRSLGPDRQQPGQHHRRIDALGGRLRRQQGEYPAQYLAGVARPASRDQRSRLGSKQRQAVRSVLGALREQA